MAERARIGSLSNLQSMGEHTSHDAPALPEELHGAPPYPFVDQHSPNQLLRHGFWWFWSSQREEARG